MVELFYVVSFDVWNLPNVRRVFAKRIARQLTFIGTLEVFLVGVLGRYPDVIEIEGVVVAFCEPQDCFIATGEPFLAVQSVAETPNYAVTQLKFLSLEQWVQQDIQWVNFAFIDVVPNLPADRSVIGEKPHRFLNRCRLSIEVVIYGQFRFILFTNVVRRGCNDQIDRTGRQGLHEREVVLTRDYRILFCRKRQGGSCSRFSNRPCDA